MGVSKRHKRNALWIGSLLMALLVSGCAGIEPYEARDHREDGLKRGLFSGADGEFVIYTRDDEPVPESAKKKQAIESIEEKEDGAQ